MLRGHTLRGSSAITLQAQGSHTVTTTPTLDTDTFVRISAQHQATTYPLPWSVQPVTDRRFGLVNIVAANGEVVEMALSMAGARLIVSTLNAATAAQTEVTQ